MSRGHILVLFNRHCSTMNDDWSLRASKDGHSSSSSNSRTLLIFPHLLQVQWAAVLDKVHISFSYTAWHSYKHCQQVYFVHSWSQDESLQVTISKLPFLTCTRGLLPCTWNIWLTSQSEGRHTYLVSSLQITLRKACSDTEFSLPGAGI